MLTLNLELFLFVKTRVFERVFLLLFGFRTGNIHASQQLSFVLEMFYLMSMIVALAFLAVWSLFMWMLHGLAVWSMSGAGALIEHSEKLDSLTLPAWITLWLPAELIVAAKAGAANVLPWLDAALSTLPSPTVWLSPLAWTVWGIGCLILAATAVLIPALFAVTRKAVRR